jgi:hypothetical protein
MRRTCGQASIEWVGLVALVCVLLALGPALAHASFVGAHITRAYARALCIVRGGDCARDTEPCVVSSRQREHRAGLDIAVVHLGGSMLGFVQRRSDGTVMVTAALSGSAGVTAGYGIKGLKIPGLDLNGALDASQIATLKGARTWVVPSMGAADDLLHGLTHHPWRLPPADFKQHDVDLLSTLHAGMALKLFGIGGDLAGADFSQARHVSTVVDQRTGHKILAIQPHREWSAEVGGGVLGVSGGDAGERYEVELDRSGDPLDLRVVATGAFNGTQDLPATLAPVAGMLQASGRGARSYEVTAHLDLTDPANLAAARKLMHAITARTPHVEGTPEPSQELRRRIDEQGDIEARVLDTVDGISDHGTEVASGEKLGYSLHAETVHTRLLAAASRGLDGNWITRDDCVAWA